MNESRNYRDVENEILWFESLLDAIEDGELEDAIAAIQAAIALLRKKRAA